MRLFRTSVDFKFLHHLLAQSAMREHSPDRFGERFGRVLRHQSVKRNPAFAADVPRMMEILLLLGLLAGRSDLARIDDDHEIAGIDVRGIDSLVLAHQKTGSGAGNATEGLAFGIDELPLTCDRLGVHHNGFHIVPLKLLLGTNALQFIPKLESLQKKTREKISYFEIFWLRYAIFYSIN